MENTLDLCTYIYSVGYLFLLAFLFFREKLPAAERDLKENYNRQESRAPR